MKKSDHHLPPELIEDIRDGNCVPVIGAGFSMNAILPDGCNMPLWDDLCKVVTTRLREKSSGSPTKDLSNYCRKRGRSELIKLLRDHLHIRTAKPGLAHIEFAKIPFEHVITTNFDFLLERAYDISNRPCLPVVDEDLLPFRPIKGETQLIKMHGDLHHPSLLVMLEEDYDNFPKQRERMFQAIAHLLVSHSILFIGYSLDDPDFRQILKFVENQFKLHHPAYALLVDASESKINEYERRGVATVVSLPINKKGYGAALANEFRAINHALNDISRKPVALRKRKVKS